MKQSVNLIPANTSMWLARRSKLRWWIRIWIAAFGFLCMTSLMLLQSQRESHKALELARSSIADVRVAMNQLQSLQSQVLQYRQAVEFGKALEQSDLPLRLVQVITKCCLNAGGGVQLKSIKLTESSVEDKTQSGVNKGKNVAGNSDQKRHAMQVTLNGVSQAERCTDFVVALRNSTEFNKVDLVSSQAISDDSGSLQAFQIRCEH